MSVGAVIAPPTSASWHRAFWASRLSDRSACCFEIKRIWLLCRHGRFSKLESGHVAHRDLLRGEERRHHDVVDDAARRF